MTIRAPSNLSVDEARAFRLATVAMRSCRLMAEAIRNHDGPEAIATYENSALEALAAVREIVFGDSIND